MSMTKFNNLRVKRVKSNLVYTESKLVKKTTTVKGRNTKKGNYHIGVTQKGITQRENTQKGITQKTNTQKGITQTGITQEGNTQKRIPEKVI